MNVNRGIAPGHLFTVLGKDQSALVREADEKVKNKWNFRWIEEVIQVKEFTVNIGDNINKVNLPEKVSCSLCHSVINYGGRGKSAFKEHLLLDMHYTKLKTLKSSYSLGSFAPPKRQTVPFVWAMQEKKNQPTSDNNDSSAAANVSPSTSAPCSAPLISNYTNFKPCNHHGGHYSQCHG